MATPSDFLELDYHQVDAATTQEIIHKRLLPFADTEIFRCKIKSSRKLTQGDDVKPKYEVVLDAKGIDHAFRPGDSIGVISINNKEEVEKLICRLNLLEIADKTYSLKILKNTQKKKPVLPPHIPIKGTLRDVLLKFVDVRAVPKKTFLRALMPYCDESDRDLLKPASDLKSTTYEDFITNKARTLLDMLELLPSCNPPMERLLEHLPPLHPRFYSIASSPLREEELRFAFSLVDCGKVKGVCTGYLESVLSVENEEIEFYFRKRNDCLTDFYADDCKVILVGPGTGVAPFIGYLEDFAMDGRSLSAVLYFGCRYGDKDFIYKEEMDGFLEKKVLCEINVALSRDNKEYVQDVIAKHGETVARKLMDEEYRVWICGSREMAKEVQSAIVKSFVVFGGVDEKEALELVVGMQKRNMYVVDVWT